MIKGTNFEIQRQTRNGTLVSISRMIHTLLFNGALTRFSGKEEDYIFYNTMAVNCYYFLMGHFEAAKCFFGKRIAQNNERVTSYFDHLINNNFQFKTKIQSENLEESIDLFIRLSVRRIMFEDNGIELGDEKYNLSKDTLEKFDTFFSKVFYLTKEEEDIIVLKN